MESFIFQFRCKIIFLTNQAFLPKLKSLPILTNAPEGNLLDPVHTNVIFLCPLRTPENQTQPAITCSKLTIGSLKQGVKYVQS